MVVETTVTVAPHASSATVVLRATESPLAPPVRGVVRMPALEGGYTLTAVGPRRTRVEYEVSLDLGGRVPGFVARGVTEEMPFETLQGLRQQLVRTRGQYVAEVARLRGMAPDVAAPPPGGD